VEKQMGVSIDEPREKGHSWKLDDAGASRADIGSGADRTDAIPANENHPALSRLRRHAVEDARGTQQNGLGGSAAVSSLRVGGNSPKQRSESEEDDA
jgi:hypothetical protein